MGGDWGQVIRGKLSPTVNIAVFIYRRENRNASDFLDLSLTIPDDRVCLRFSTFSLFGKICDGRETVKFPIVWDFPTNDNQVLNFKAIYVSLFSGILKFASSYFCRGFAAIKKMTELKSDIRLN